MGKRPDLRLMDSHIDLDGDEWFVHVNSVALPWDFKRVRAKLLSSVRPDQWHSLNGGVITSEYIYLPDDIVSYHALLTQSESVWASDIYPGRQKTAA